MSSYQEKKRPDPLPTEEQITQFHNALINDPKWVTWLYVNRCLNLDSLKHSKIGLAKHYGRWGFSIPVRDRAGIIVEVHYRNIKPDGEPKLWWRKGAKAKRIYGLIHPPEPGVKRILVVCEGEFDALLLYQLGFDVLTSTGGAATIAEILRDNLDLVSGSDVVLVLDKDEAGRSATEACKTVLPGKVELLREIVWPEGFSGKDVTDYVRECGPEAFHSLVAAAVLVHHVEVGNERMDPEEAPFEIDERPWPDPPDEAAFHGLAGEFVYLVLPHTEADRAALLTQFLPSWGNLSGRNAFFHVGADKHYPNLFVVNVGGTAIARKGSALSCVRFVLQNVDPEWDKERVQKGLISGEGLIHAVRDPVFKREPVKEKGRILNYQMVEVDPGVSDKRLMAIEEEFASPLMAMKRTGNTLSTLLRSAWDGRDKLQNMNKNSPEKATGGHISMIAHIVERELVRFMTDTEYANGFANRFQWFCVRRSKSLPDGGEIYAVEFGPLIGRLKNALQFVQNLANRRIEMNSQARSLWREEYERLTSETPGIVGEVVARAAPQVLRTALVYALLDCSDVIQLPHLRAALAVSDYSFRSVCYIFGDTQADPLANAILAALRTRPEGMTRKEINVEVFKGNRKAEEIIRALADLRRNRLANYRIEATGGRPRETWFVIGTTNKTNETYNVGSASEDKPPGGYDSSYDSFNSSHKGVSGQPTYQDSETPDRDGELLL